MSGRKSQTKYAGQWKLHTPWWYCWKLNNNLMGSFSLKTTKVLHNWGFFDLIRFMLIKNTKYLTGLFASFVLHFWRAGWHSGDGRCGQGGGWLKQRSHWRQTGEIPFLPTMWEFSVTEQTAHFDIYGMRTCLIILMKEVVSFHIHWLLEHNV